MKFFIFFIHLNLNLFNCHENNINIINNIHFYIFLYFLNIYFPFILENKYDLDLHNISVKKTNKQKKTFQLILSDKILIFPSHFNTRLKAGKLMYFNLSN